MASATARTTDVRHDLQLRRPLRAVHVGIGLWAGVVAPSTRFAPSRTEPARRVRALIDALGETGDPQVVVTSHRRGRSLVTGAAISRPATRQDDRRRGVITVPTRGWDDLPVARTVGMVSRLAGTADVIHLHLRHAGALPAAAAIVLRSPVPVVVHLQGSVLAPLSTGDRSSVRTRLVGSWFETRVLSSAAAVIAASPRLAEVATDAGAGRVEVVPPAELPVASPSGHRPLPGAGDGRRIVSVGALTGRRRPDALVRALAVQPPDTHLVLLGDGPERLTVDRTATEMSVADRVHVVPTVTWQAVTDHLAHADVVATAALSGEDPTVTMLAMATGRPVVATSVESLPVLVTDGVDGLLVAPGDDDALAGAIRSVLVDTDLAVELADSARRRRAATGWSTIAERVRAVARV